MLEPHKVIKTWVDDDNFTHFLVEFPDYHVKLQINEDGSGDVHLFYRNDQVIIKKVPGTALSAIAAYKASEPRDAKIDFVVESDEQHHFKWMSIQ